MKKTTGSPALKKEVDKFLDKNPKIKEALDVFKISEAQYEKALRSMEPHTTTSNKVIIEIEA